MLTVVIFKAEKLHPLTLNMGIECWHILDWVLSFIYFGTILFLCASDMYFEHWNLYRSMLFSKKK